MRNYNSIFKSQQKSIKSLDKCQRTLIDNGGGDRNDQLIHKKPSNCSSDLKVN